MEVFKASMETATLSNLYKMAASASSSGGASSTGTVPLDFTELDSEPDIRD